MSYSDLLKDRRWQQKRLEVLDAAGWVCECCGSEDNSMQLHVHHKRYVRGRKPWEYPAEELQALCERCHSETSDASKLLESAIDAAKMEGDTAVMFEAAGLIDATVRPNCKMRVATYEHACGIARACLIITPEFVIGSLDKDNCVTPVELVIAWKKANGK